MVVMAKYIQFKKRVFRLKKEARAWAEKQKEDSKLGDLALKIETNYIPSSGMWEAILFKKE